MVLTDLIELHLQGKQAHWNLVGTNFRDLHLQLDEFPEGLTSTKDTVKLITARLERTVQTMRDVHDDVDDEDPTSADLLHAAIERLEQLAWMVNAETMSATASVTERAAK